MNYFLDTSALVKLYHTEKGSEYIDTELSKHQDELILTVSELSKLEFHSVILKKVRTKKLKLNKAQQVFQLLEQDWKEFNCITIDNDLKSNALNLLQQLAPNNNLGTLDALQLSSALVAQQILPIDYFITADKRLLNLAKIYFATLNPEANL